MRLKGFVTEDGHVLGPIQFQFQIGAIKSESNFEFTSRSRIRFNSKLVRLKVPYVAILTGVDRFQFQIGAIKRCHVPIPVYKPITTFQFQIGAIKSSETEELNTEHFECFNSKLVRLKVYN